MNRLLFLLFFVLFSFAFNEENKINNQKKEIDLFKIIRKTNNNEQNKIKPKKTRETQDSFAELDDPSIALSKDKVINQPKNKDYSINQFDIELMIPLRLSNGLLVSRSFKNIYYDIDFDLIHYEKIISDLRKSKTVKNSGQTAFNLGSGIGYRTGSFDVQALLRYRYRDESLQELINEQSELKRRDIELAVKYQLKKNKAIFNMNLDFENYSSEILALAAGVEIFKIDWGLDLQYLRSQSSSSGYHFDYVFNIFDQFNHLHSHNLFFSFYQNLEFLKQFKVKLGFKTALELLYQEELQNTYWFFVPDLAISIESKNALWQTKLSIDGSIGENKYLQNQISFDYLFPSINQLLDKRIDFTLTSKLQYKKNI